MGMISGVVSAAGQAVNKVSTMGINAANADAQFRQQKADIAYQQDLHRYNARMIDRERMRIDRERNESDERARRDAETERSSVRAAYGASGVVMTGSPLEYLSETAAAQEMAILDQRRAYRLESQELERKAYMERYQADTVLAAQKDQLKRQRMQTIGMTVADSLGAFGLNSDTANMISKNAAGFSMIGKGFSAGFNKMKTTIGGMFR